MLWWLVLLLAFAFRCSFLAPDSGLHRSALQAFDSSVCMLNRAERVENEPVVSGGAEGTLRGGISAFAPQRRSLRTSSIRRRVTPLMQKRVAVRYNFRCALCHLPLDETWETDHRTPLSQARTAAEAERLNSLENLQPVHRACHQLKSSREATSR